MPSVNPDGFPYEKLSISRFRFTLWAETDVVFHSLPASHWRSALGSLLYDVSGQSIPKYHETTYQELFNPQPRSSTDKRDPVRPIMLHADPWKPTTLSAGSFFYLEVSIFGNYLRGIETLLHAVLSLQSLGLGNKKSHSGGQFRVLSLDQALPDQKPQRHYDPWQYTTPHHWATPILNSLSTHPLESWLRSNMAEPNGKQNIFLRFTRPLNFKIKGKPIQAENFTFSEFIRALYRRNVDLFLNFGEGELLFPDLEDLLDEARKVQIFSKNIWYKNNLSRYSARQLQELKLSGMIGEWGLKDVSQPLRRFLEAGSFTHCGKNTVLGLGKYELY